MGKIGIKEDKSKLKIRRNMGSAEGYKYLLTYKQGQEIYQRTKEFTERYLHPIKDSRLIGHMNDSGRSNPRNIAEGYKRNDTKTYIDFLGFARASNEELKEDFKELEREYREGIRIDKENDKEEMIRVIEEILTKIYGEDCMLGRQIEGLKKKYILSGDQKDKLKEDRKDYHKKQIVNNWISNNWN